MKSPSSFVAAAPGSSRLHRFRHLAGLDFHVFATLLFRGWTVIAGVATMLLLPACLDPVRQGYYYAFASILALQVFFELGLNQVIVQLVSHEAAHLQTAPDGTFTGAAAHLDTLASLARMLRRWYLVAALLFALGAGSAGLVFFARKGGLPLAQWVGPWLLLVAVSAANLYVSPRLAMLEGTGRVGHVARLRLAQSCAGYVGLWLALLSGCGLWSAAATTGAAAVGTAWWLHMRGHALQQLASRPSTPDHAVAWRRDVFPLQWRIAVSWVSGYFIFNLFTPLVFAHSGPIEAGRLGLALTMFNALSTIGMSWVNAKAPQFTMHIARGERGTLEGLFRHVIVRSTLATTALCAVVVIGATTLATLGVPAMARIAPVPVLACLAVVTVVNGVIFGAATFMRAHREEPMLPVSVVTGALTAAAAWFGSRAGLLPMVAAYAAVTMLVALPWTLALRKRYAARTA